MPDPAPTPAASGGAPQAQLPPSSFDAAMLRMNDVPPIHGDPPRGSAPNVPEQRGPSRTEPLPTDSPDPNDPAELAAREELLRGTKAKPEDQTEQEHGRQPLTDDAAEAAEFAEWREAKKSLKLSEKFHDRLVNVPWGEKGETRDVPVSEARLGYMRMLDATRKNQASAEVKRQGETAMQQTNAFLTDLAQGKMRETLEDMGFGEQLYAAAEEIYQEQLAIERHFYGLTKKGVDDQTLNFLRERLEAEKKGRLSGRARDKREARLQQQLQQRQTQESHDAESQQMANRLAQLRPLAFKHVQMPDDPLHQRAFQQTFLSILETGGGQGRELRDIVLDAAVSAKQLVEEHIKKTQDVADEETRTARELSMPLSPQRLPGSSPRAGNGSQPAPQKRLSVNDFDAEMARQDGYRQ